MPNILYSITEIQHENNKIKKQKRKERKKTCLKKLQPAVNKVIDIHTSY